MPEPNTCTIVLAVSAAINTSINIYNVVENSRNAQRLRGWTVGTWAMEDWERYKTENEESLKKSRRTPASPSNRTTLSSHISATSRSIRGVSKLLGCYTLAPGSFLKKVQHKVSPRYLNETLIPDKISESKDQNLPKVVENECPLYPDVCRAIISLRQLETTLFDWQKIYEDETNPDLAKIKVHLKAANGAFLEMKGYLDAISTKVSNGNAHLKSQELGR